MSLLNNLTSSLPLRLRVFYESELPRHFLYDVTHHKARNDLNAGKMDDQVASIETKLQGKKSTFKPYI